jgi:hypothetical protein
MMGQPSLEAAAHHSVKFILVLGLHRQHTQCRA